MKILFIEADKYLDDHQEKFHEKLILDGHSTSIITDCYNNIDYIKAALVHYCPDVIVVQTTFVYDARFKAFEPVYKLLTYPVELWYMGACSGARFVNYIPEKTMKNITIYDIWADIYGENLPGDNFKKLISKPE